MYVYIIYISYGMWYDELASLLVTCRRKNNEFNQVQVV